VDAKVKAEPGHLGGKPSGALIGLVGVLALGGLFALGFAVLLIGFPWEWFPGERLNTYFADRLAGGESPYRDWSEPGGLVAPIYPPGMYWLFAPFQAVFGGELWVGRTLATASFGLAGLAAYAIARGLGSTRAEGAASGLGVFAFALVGTGLVVAARPDALAVGLTGGLVAAITAWEGRRAPALLWLAAAAATALILTKHNFAPLVAGIVVAVWLRDRRAAARLALAAAAGTIALAALAQVTSGGAFFDNMSDFTRSGYSLGSLGDALEAELLPFPNPLYVVGALEVVAAMRSWRDARAVHWAWLGSLLVTLTAVKLGAAANYWLATAFLSAALLGPALARLRSYAPAASAAAAAALALLLLPGIGDRVQTLRDFNRGLPGLEESNAEAAAVLERAGGRVFGDRPDLILEAGQDPSFDAAPFRLLADRRAWDPGPTARALGRAEFGTVQASFDLLADPIRTYQGIPDWPPQLVHAVRASYCPLWSSGGPLPVYVYEPCGRGGRAAVRSPGGSGG
jgi:hypothetical protein